MRSSGNHRLTQASNLHRAATGVAVPDAWVQVQPSLARDLTFDKLN
ncbi:MAG TPA: hypothetical protein VFI95_24250 [Terriglobales bacterium]|nr:hypothetical protein [Terriglobales bacterium]